MKTATLLRTTTFLAGLGLSAGAIAADAPTDAAPSVKAAEAPADTGDQRRADRDQKRADREQERAERKKAKEAEKASRDEERDQKRAERKAEQEAKRNQGRPGEP